MSVDQSKFFEAVLSIIRSGHWITDQVSRLLKAYDISEPQFNVLRILRGQKGNPISVQAIQEKMVQRSSNVTRIIDKLLKKKLVERKECSENRRKMDITITKDGLEYLEKLDDVVIAFYEPYKNNLTDQEAEQLIGLIKKLNTN